MRLSHSLADECISVDYIRDFVYLCTVVCGIPKVQSHAGDCSRSMLSLAT